MLNLGAQASLYVMAALTTAVSRYRDLSSGRLTTLSSASSRTLRSPSSASVNRRLVLSVGGRFAKAATRAASRSC